MKEPVILPGYIHTAKPVPSRHALQIVFEVDETRIPEGVGGILLDLCMQKIEVTAIFGETSTLQRIAEQFLADTVQEEPPAKSEGLSWKFTSNPKFANWLYENGAPLPEPGKESDKVDGREVRTAYKAFMAEKVGRKIISTKDLTPSEIKASIDEFNAQAF